jgi:hypothetical protein
MIRPAEQSHDQANIDALDALVMLGLIQIVEISDAGEPPYVTAARLM